MDKIRDIRKDVDEIKEANCLKCNKPILARNDFYAEYSTKCSKCMNELMKPKDKERLHADLIKYGTQIGIQQISYQGLY